jgi:hypothetical protein
MTAVSVEVITVVIVLGLTLARGDPSHSVYVLTFVVGKTVSNVVVE